MDKKSLCFWYCDHLVEWHDGGSDRHLGSLVAVSKSVDVSPDYQMVYNELNFVFFPNGRVMRVDANITVFKIFHKIRHGVDREIMSELYSKNACVPAHEFEEMCDKIRERRKREEDRKLQEKRNNTNIVSPNIGSKVSGPSLISQETTDKTEVTSLKDNIASAIIYILYLVMGIMCGFYFVSEDGWLVGLLKAWLWPIFLIINWNDIF